MILYPPPVTRPRILTLDIETKPLDVRVWSLKGNEYIHSDRIQSDTAIMAWSAKWLDSPEAEVMYADNRKAKNILNDRKIVRPLWKLMSQADIIITKNGKRFDVPRINAQFLTYDLAPLTMYRHIDTERVVRRNFSFTSYSLDYLAKKFDLKHKKLVKRKYSGNDLWDECLAGNMDAWDEMQKYNCQDVLATEELYIKVRPWDSSVNFDVYHGLESNECPCGGFNFKKNGFKYTNTGKFQRYVCRSCGKEVRGKENLLSKAKRKSLVST